MSVAPPTDFSALVEHCCRLPLAERQQKARRLRIYAEGLGGELEAPFGARVVRQLHEIANLIEAGRQ